MSPLSTALPAPSVSILQRAYGPVPPGYVNHGKNQNSSIPWFNTVVLPSQGRGGVIVDQGQEVYSHGGTGSIYRWANLAGRRCIRAQTDTNDEGACAPFGSLGWDPNYGPGAVNAGARINSPAAVMSWSWHFAMTAAAALPDDDRTGFLWVPAAPQAAITNVGTLTPFAGTGGGFGIFANDDGAGGITWEFVSWDQATILLRVPIPASVIPDVTAWSTARFVAVTGGATPATLALDVNGTEIVAAEFDDVSLMRPASYTRADWNGLALGYMPGFEFGPMLTLNDVFMSWEGWVGRFTPEGVEVEGP